MLKGPKPHNVFVWGGLVKMFMRCLFRKLGNVFQIYKQIHVHSERDLSAWMGLKTPRNSFSWNPSSSKNSFAIQSHPGYSKSAHEKHKEFLVLHLEFLQQHHHHPGTSGTPKYWVFPHIQAIHARGNIRRHLHSFSWKGKLFEICLTESRLWVKVRGKAPWL